MGKTTKAVYEPGELGRVRNKLGDIDEAEAKRMAKILGGEIGVEKDVNEKAMSQKSSPSRRDTVELAVAGSKKRRPGRLVELAGTDEGSAGSVKESPPEPVVNDPNDDPSIPLKTSYRERIKMDRHAAQPDFEIKNSMQVLFAVFSFFSDPADYVNPRFINRRINVYINKIEHLVNSTKSLLPRNNAARSERLKKTSPFAFAILDVIRNWNIEKINADYAKIQAHSNAAKATEFAEILQAVYKPLFILGKLDINKHIKEAYKLLYKLLYIESPMENKEKNQELIRTAVAYFGSVKREVHFSLYPLLMRLISDQWFSYSQLFNNRRRCFMSFIGVSESDQIKPLDLNVDQSVNNNLEKVQEEINSEATLVEPLEEEESLKSLEEKAKEAAIAAEKKALNQSLNTLELLFPQAGWNKLGTFPDLYPYFVNVYGLRRGYELIAPNDPLQQAAVLMHILEDLCVAMRYVSFGSVRKNDGSLVNVNTFIGDIITNWRRYIDDSFIKEYLPRLSEYCRMLETSAESMTSVFAKRNLNELRWTKRLYFLPYYKFESFGPPPFQKQEVIVIYNEIKTLRKNLTLVAAGIEQGNRKGGSEAKAPCEGINNPWAAYNFAVPNPVSRRMDALLGQGKRNNAALIFFALSVATILDYLLNNEDSWAYADSPKALFRSVDGNGVIPMFGVEEKINADQLFKDSLKRK